MSISAEEAHQSLAAIATAGRESRTRFSYRKAAPFMLGWGAVWACGYTASATMSLDAANWVWLVLIAAMTIVTAITMRRHSNVRPTWTKVALYSVLPSAGLIVLVNLASYALGMHRAIDILALYGLVIAAAYAIAGARHGRRYTVLGLSLAAVTATGMLTLPPALQISVFFIDAGLLIAAGLWFRRA